ncbi:MAG TPA: hypothetical protein VN673_16960, partial [Clostridia bacterium]|nr:hypothetical protein [Clostridia bacterium]
MKLRINPLFWLMTMVVGTMIFPFRAAAETQTTTPPGFEFTTFSSWTNGPCLTFQGHASITGSVLRVSPSLEGTVGSAWHCNKQPLANGFSTEFVFRISDIGCWSSLPQCGGDGIGFILQNVGLHAIAMDSGMTRGFTNASVAVTFDTFWNWPGSYDLEPGDNFVGIAVNQQWVATRDLTPLGINLSDGTAHKAGIYCSGTQLLILLDNQCIMTNDLGQAAFAQAADAAGMSWV